MKQNYIEITFGVLFIIMLLFIAIPMNISRQHSQHIETVFHIFMEHFNRTYYQNETEYRKRYHIFEQTFDRIMNINNTKMYGESAEFGITKFSDITDQEFSEIYLFIDTANKSIPFHTEETVNEETPNNAPVNNLMEFRKRGYPMRIDWRDHGIVTEIRNQGSCGSCYAQSVIGTIESQMALLMKNSTQLLREQNHDIKLVELSVQQMIDCAGNSNYGCLGGDICNLLEWLQSENISILTDELYPRQEDVILGGSNKSPSVKLCQSQRILNGLIETKPKLVRVIDYTCYNFVGHEYEMLAMIAEKGPVAASVNGLLWKNYLGGVIKYHCNGPTNHAVQIVGYDLTTSDPYYLVRNSWGPEFGLNGYAKIGINNNVCNIAAEVSSINIDLE